MKSPKQAIEILYLFGLLFLIIALLQKCVPELTETGISEQNKVDTLIITKTSYDTVKIYHTAVLRNDTLINYVKGIYSFLDVNLDGVIDTNDLKIIKKNMGVKSNIKAFGY